MTGLLLDYCTIQLTIQITTQYHGILVLNRITTSYPNPLLRYLIVQQSLSSSCNHHLFCTVQYSMKNNCHLISNIYILITLHIKIFAERRHVVIKVYVVVLCLLKVHIVHPLTFAGLYFHLCPCQSVQAIGHH